MYSAAAATFPNYPVPDYAIVRLSRQAHVPRVRPRLPRHAGLVLTGATRIQAPPIARRDPESCSHGTIPCGSRFSSGAAAPAAPVDAMDLARDLPRLHSRDLRGRAGRSLLRASAALQTGVAQPRLFYYAIHCRGRWADGDRPSTENDNPPIDFNNMVVVWTRRRPMASWRSTMLLARSRWRHVGSEHLAATGADMQKR